MYSRRVLHHGPDPAGAATLLSDRVIEGCWFELQRQGGCGAGELQLKDDFADRHAIEIGDWISCEYDAGERWYLGRVEARTATSPAGVKLRLEGMGIELNEVFPGGFAIDADNVPPHRFGRTDLFANDPDYAVETFDAASDVTDLVTLLLQRYVAPATHIQYDAGLIELPPGSAPLESVKFRGEESARSIIKQLALAARGAAWGVTASGRFFFLQPRDVRLTILREGRDLVSLEESRDRELLFNRLLLTGDYVYDTVESGWIARRASRFRGNYVQTESRDLNGERRIRLWIPWIRTPEDALLFAREFFRVYASPTSRYALETKGRRTLLLPWTGHVRLEDRDGAIIAVTALETVRVLFDHVPQFRMELGPADPRTLWPEPPQDERWELPELQLAGGQVPLTGSTSSALSSSASDDSDESDESEVSEDSDDSEESEESEESLSGPTSGTVSEESDSESDESDNDSESDASDGSESSGGDSSGDSSNSDGSSDDESSDDSSAASDSDGESISGESDSDASDSDDSSSGSSSSGSGDSLTDE